MVECLRKVVAGETWLDTQGIRWVMEAYRNQTNRPAGARPKVQLTPKETLIVSCVTQGMKNKEIALRVGTTEQVVKNYLRKVYDKLGVADRLELALYCLNHHVVDNTKVPALPASAANGGAANAAAAGASSSGTSAASASSTVDAMLRAQTTRRVKSRKNRSIAVSFLRSSCGFCDFTHRIEENDRCNRKMLRLMQLLKESFLPNRFTPERWPSG